MVSGRSGTLPVTRLHKIQHIPLVIVRIQEGRFPVDAALRDMQRNTLPFEARPLRQGSRWWNA
jgi:hypothetical protein